jgi:hypothetical protein
MSFRYPEATAHGGRLEYHGPIPVLTVAGGPAEVGRQVGELALRPAMRLLDYPLDYLRSQVRVPLLPQLFWALLQRKCRGLYANIPAAYRAEAAACAAVCPDGGRLVAVNTLFDMSHMGLRPLFGCSSIVVPPRRSATGGLLFGRNLDFYPLGYLHDFSLVTVYRPEPGRLGFASVGFPGLVGCFSGMNAAGLSLARHEVLAPKVRRAFDPTGVPFAVALRGVLETCRAVAEATDRLGRIKHATVNIVVLADPDSALVLELTPDGVFAREPDGDLIGCSNHFRHPAIANANQPNAYGTLDRHATLQRVGYDAPPVRLGRDDVWAALGRVHQGELTLQSMVFEPAARAVHIAFGVGPTTARRPTTLELGPLLDGAASRLSPAYPIAPGAGAGPGSRSF